MYKIVITMILLLLFTGCSSTDKDVEVTTYQKITPQEAKAMMTEDVIILDVRTQEYEEGHIADAMLIPIDILESEALTLLENMDQTILVYCRSGNRSQRASVILVNLGYKNIYDFGGINTWIEPLVK